MAAKKTGLVISLVLGGVVVGGVFVSSVKAEDQTPAPTTTNVTSGPNSGTCGSSNSGGPNSTVTPQQCGNGIGVGVTTNPNTTSDANGNKLDNNSPSSAQLTGTVNPTINGTTGPSSADVNSAINNALTLNPNLTTTDINALRQQLQSDPTLTSKLNSTNKADQTAALNSVNKLNNGSASNATNQGISTPVTVNQPNNSQYINKVDARVLAPNELHPTSVTSAGEYILIQNGDMKMVLACNDAAINRGFTVNTGFGLGGSWLGVKVLRGNHEVCAINKQTIDRGINAIIDTFGNKPPMVWDAEAAAKALAAAAQAQKIDIRINNNGGGNTPPPVVVKHGA